MAIKEPEGKKTREQEEKDNYEILLKAAGGDPKALAAALKEMLLRDKTIVAPAQKPADKKEDEMMEAVRDILKMDKRRR
ncbi:MAG: hypothetical protein FWG12_07315 [Holophagaceae bacterium]|jgi:hypothetical protein|nr:hypothetical protein [Holophagaceae bacterium]